MLHEKYNHDSKKEKVEDVLKQNYIDKWGKICLLEIGNSEKLLQKRNSKIWHWKNRCVLEEPACKFHGCPVFNSFANQFGNGKSMQYP